jgi:hypothetical protein
MSFVDWTDEPFGELFEPKGSISQTSFLTYIFYLLKSL